MTVVPCGRGRLLRSPRAHASVLGQRAGADMMPVRCRSDLPIPLTCSNLSAGNSPDRGSVGPPSLRGPRRPALRQSTGEAKGACAAWAVTGGEVRKAVPSCRGDNGRPPAAVPDNLGRPCPQPCRAPALHHDGRGLAQVPSQPPVPRQVLHIGRTVATSAQPYPRLADLCAAKGPDPAPPLTLQACDPDSGCSRAFRHGPPAETRRAPGCRQGRVLAPGELAGMPSCRGRSLGPLP